MNILTVVVGVGAVVIVVVDGIAIGVVDSMRDLCFWSKQ